MPTEVSPPFIISAFASAVLEQDYELAHSYLSNGMRERMDLPELRSTLLEAEEDAGTPVNFAWKQTDMNYREWKACCDSAAGPDVYPDSFLSYSAIVFEGDFEPCYELWCVLVDEDGMPRIGFFEITDPE
jgi:hypothetical protein